MNVPARTKENALQELPEGYDASSQSLAVSLAIAEVDQQVTTARTYPRSIEASMKRIMSLATLDGETAQECIYAMPRDGKAVKGPSIRLAEVIQSQWGNNRVGTRVVHVDRIEKYIEAEGVFYDLETNSATTARVRRRISDKRGRLYSDDMIIVTGNAAASIAKRNAILAGVPKAVWRRAYAAVEQVLVGDVKTLVERRGEALKAFAAFGVKPEQLFAALDIKGLDDIDLDRMTILQGMHSALKNGEATVEEMFETGTKTTKPAGDLTGRLDRLADESAGPGEGSGEGLQQSSAAADASTKTGSPGPTASAPGVDGDEQQTPHSPSSPSLRNDAIAEAMQIATRSDFDEGQRLEKLDALQMALTDQLSEDPGFVNNLIRTAAKVAKKELQKVAALKYLNSLVKA